MVVSHESIRRWTDKFGTGFAQRGRTARRKLGSTCPNARSRSCRAAVRSASTSRSSVICCAPRSIANNSPCDLKRGVSSPALPKLRPPRSERRPSLPISRHAVSNVTAPISSSLRKNPSSVRAHHRKCDLLPAHDYVIARDRCGTRHAGRMMRAAGDRSHTRS